MLTPCETTLPRLKNSTGAALKDALNHYFNIYSDCAARHNALVLEIKQRQ